MTNRRVLQEAATHPCVVCGQPTRVARAIRNDDWAYYCDDCGIAAALRGRYQIVYWPWGCWRMGFGLRRFYSDNGRGLYRWALKIGPLELRKWTR